jgi:hypothetical protein
MLIHLTLISGWLRLSRNRIRLIASKLHQRDWPDHKLAQRVRRSPPYLVRSEQCWLSSHAPIMARGLVRSVENADPADTSGFDRFAAQGTTLSALIAFAG